MIDVEDRLREELDRCTPLFRPADWNEVLALSNDGSARTAHKRARISVFGSTKQTRVALLLVAAVVLAILAAPALGLAPPFLDFFSSKHASKRVVHSFALLNVGAPRGMSPHVISGETRRVTTYRLSNGKTMPLWVAPTRKGGFCVTFGFGGGCTSTRPPATSSNHDQAGNRNAAQIELGIYGSRVLAGDVFDTRIAKIEIRFRHAAAASVPLLWVSPPINAGFFFYEIPRKLIPKAPGNRLGGPVQPIAGPVSAVVALDEHGHEIARIASIFRRPPAWFNPAAVSDRSKRHTVLRSGRLSIVIAPSRTGGNCFWLKVDTYQVAGSGCAPPRLLTLAMVGGLSHGSGFTGFWVQVQPTVTRVELRFEDGVHVTLQPVDGHVLYDIPAAHWPRHHRLRTAIAYASSGKAVLRQSFDTKQIGVYDCAKPVPIGAGQKACP
jgi:hypothetical protein